MATKIYIFLVLFLGLFFRTFRLEEHFFFELDQEINSFIVKDILVEGHMRLIGQMSSVEGFFVGSLQNYLSLPFYALLRMDPIAAVIPALLIALSTIVSIYFIFSKFLGKNAGKIGAFLYAVSVPIAFIDRWVVPSQAVLLWSVWFLYSLFSIINGNFKALIVLAVLVGLLWHIHPSLLPMILLIPIAFLMSKEKVKFQQLIVPALIIIVGLFPLLLFEIRHNFTLISAILNLFGEKGAGLTFVQRLNLVISGSSLMITNVFLEVKINPTVSFIIFIFALVFARFKQTISKKQTLIIIFWFAVVICGQLFSKRNISQYYFDNLIIPSLFMFSAALSVLDRYKLSSKVQVTALFLILIGLVNLYMFYIKPINPFNYSVKKQVVEFIKTDSQMHNFPCIGLDFVADFGRGVGFRYLFWQSNVELVKPGVGAPVYKIVLPRNQLPENVDLKFGKVGVFLPEENSFSDSKVCADVNNKLDPVWGLGL